MADATSFGPTGLRVVVTGASSGIGAATAVELARRGTDVGICAPREDRLRESKRFPPYAPTS